MISFDAALETARGLLVDADGPVTVAVVDPAGAPLVVLRAEGAPAFSVDVAVGKARTAAAFVRFRPTDGLTLDPYLGARWWFLEVPLAFNPGGPQAAPERAWAVFVAGQALGIAS